MKPKEYIIWLKGFVEACHEYAPSPKQWDALKDKLKEVDDSIPLGGIISDNNTFEEARLNDELLGDLKCFLVDDMQVEILFHNERPLDITLPNFVEMQIAETEPGAGGDTAANVAKPAKLANGYEINVPIFINEGDTVRIDTRTGTYSDRVSKG